MSLPKSIADHIDCLARLTNAPDSFVGQVRQLFTMKGISLDEDAAPYLQALEEAFRREEQIRARANSVQTNLSKIRDRFDQIGKNYVKQLERLRGAESKGGNAKTGTQKRDRVTEVTVVGDHRSLVTKPQYDSLPMVPGPKERQ
ncbi:MAG: hypothetical protein GY716_24070 [bacterium]|nr:hypothetical protein [bacterium]